MARLIKRSLADNTLTQGDTLLLALMADPSASVTVNVAGPSVHSSTGTADAQTGKIEVSFDTRSGWGAGEYLWEATQTLNGITSRLDRQRFTLVPSIANISAGTDIRTTAEQAVAMLEASLSGNSTAEVQQYKINNRELRRYPIPERLALLAYWKRQVQRERRASRGSSALGSRIQVSI